MKIKFLLTLGFIILYSACCLSTRAQGSSLNSITYQGRLHDTNGAANGLYDFSFALFPASTGGSQIGTTVTRGLVPVTNGLFTVALEFPDANSFSGADRWLEIAVHPSGVGASVTLSPRQQITAAPYAIRAANLSGPLPLSQLPAGVVTNDGTGVTLAGTFTGNGAGLSNVNAATLGGPGSAGFWKTNGNAGANPTNGAFLGTTDNLPVEIRVNGQRALRLEPTPNGKPNIIWGSAVNSVAAEVFGTTISGGGNNQADTGASYATIGGGQYNVFGADSAESTIGGGYRNTIETSDSTIGGGAVNTIETNSPYSTIAGGVANRILAGASLSTIGGGNANLIESNAQWSAIPGGVLNTAGGKSSFAAGYRAKAMHPGSFVWADSTDADIASTGTNQFIIRAGGGVGINTNNPDGAALAVNGNVKVNGVITGNGAGLTNLPGVVAAQAAFGGVMQPNGSYTALAMSESGTTYQLPTAANIGDVVRVNGVGEGSWQIDPGPGQTINGYEAGTEWSPSGPSDYWRGVASSADGNRLVAVTWPGSIHQTPRIYQSFDRGLNWQSQIAGGISAFLDGWSAVASSADGSKLVAAESTGQIYTADNYGSFWVPRGINAWWSSVASSADGSKLVATAGGGQIYTSTDSGVNWFPRESNRNWRSVASSADGTKLVAAVSDGQIYTSTDSGVNWFPRESNRSWSSVASSADGSRLVAAVSGGQIYTSTDSGAAWTPAFMLFGGNQSWSSVASSADGMKLVAASGRIYTSADGGANWTANNKAFGGTYVASSADGNRLVAAPFFSGQIHTSIPGPAGLQGANIELQYAGNGVWVPLAASATTITSGVLADAHLSDNVALRNRQNHFTENQTMAGRLGIGNQLLGTPHLLQVGDTGTPGSEGMMRFASRSGAGPSTRVWDIGVPQGNENTSGKFYSFVVDNPQLGANPEVVVRWDTGNVGLGTPNPQASLHVYSANNPTVVRVQSTGTPGFGRLEFVSNPQGDVNEWRPGYIQSTDEGGFVGGLAFFVNGAGAGNKFGSNEVMRIVNGRVGIGTPAPVSALQVIGTVTATAFNPPSDRNLKENFTPISPRDVLDKIAAMPISRWNFKGDAATPHVGPMAQDFHAAFGLGTDNKHIATVDADGVALAAIQGLNQKVDAKERRIHELEEAVSELKQLVRELSGKKEQAQ